jgi:NitT/TauT family transport system substrate-binding protein
MTQLTRAGFLRVTAASAAWLGTGARAEHQDTVTVGCIQLPTNAPLYIAMEKGFFSEQGIKVELTFFTAAASVFSAVVSRDVDVGVTSTTAATYNLAARGGFKIIGGTTRDAPHFPLNAFLASNKAYEAGFTSLSKMAGRRFAMTTAGSSHHYDIGLLAKKYGVKMSSIALVPLENYGNITAALQSGQVDAAILPPSQSQRLLDAKAARFLGWSGDEVPEQQGIIVASPQTLARRRDAMQKFMQADAQGAELYHRTFNQVDANGVPVKGPGYAEFINIIARHSAIKPEQAEAQVAYIIPDLAPDQADIMAQIAFWQEQGMVPRNADFGNLFDLSLLPIQRDHP